MPEVVLEDGTELSKAPELEEYYHGHIDRNEAERRLKHEGIPNSYLLRLGRNIFENDRWDTIYVLSYLSSTLQCHHFKCSIGDRFLLVAEDANWVLATSFKTRHSGYLPKCCVEKEYPELIERLSFFHPDVTSDQSKTLLKRAGAYSYLLRSCDSKPGLYTLLLYDGSRMRKYRLELVTQSESFPPPPPLVDDTGDGSSTTVTTVPTIGHRRSSEPVTHICVGDTGLERNGFNGSDDEAGASAAAAARRRSGGDAASRSNSFSPSPTCGTAHPSSTTTMACQTERRRVVYPRYRTNSYVVYNGTQFSSVEALVSTITATLNHARQQATAGLASHLSNRESVTTSAEVSGLMASDGFAGMVPVGEAEDCQSIGPSTTVVFKPVSRERKPNVSSQPSAIYMAVQQTRPTTNQSTTLDIHGELSMLVNQRRKWKSYYAQLDGKQGILTLRDRDKHKPERFDLSTCDYFPVHQFMYDRPYCFGLLLCGASPIATREELVFSIDAPLPTVTQLSPPTGLSTGQSVPSQSASSTCTQVSVGGPSAGPCGVSSSSSQSATIATANTNGVGTSVATAVASAGHRIGLNRSQQLQQQHTGLYNLRELDRTTYAARPDEVTSTASSPSPNSSVVVFAQTAVSTCPNCSINDAIAAGSNAQSVALETIFARWTRHIRLQCRNTRIDSANEEDLTRRRTHLRCYRTLEVKVNGAKLLPSIGCKGRRDVPAFVVSLDGTEIARAYTGSSPVSIMLDDFPFGFKKVEVLVREDNRRKRVVAMDVDLRQFNSDQPCGNRGDECTTADATSSSSAVRRGVSTRGGGGGSSGNQRSRGPPISDDSKSTICDVRQAGCGQGSITYRELHVLPFPCYDQLREAIRSSLDSELVPLCLHVWKNMPKEMPYKSSFVSSLLWTATELKCHLQLIVNLLKGDLMPDNPTDWFRGNTLGTQILDHYCNTICSTWRQECFRRVREDAIQPSYVQPASSHTVYPLGSAVGLQPPSQLSQSANAGGGGGATGLLTHSWSSADRLSMHSQSQSTGSTITTTVTTNLSGFETTNNNNTIVSGFTNDFGCQSGSLGSPSSSVVCGSTALIPHTNVEQEWRSRLVAIAVEDLINHVSSFPLQVRWVYSELQALQTDQSSQSVVRNLVFLRGICPCLSSPTPPATTTTATSRGSCTVIGSTPANSTTNNTASSSHSSPPTFSQSACSTTTTSPSSMTSSNIHHHQPTAPTNGASSTGASSPSGPLVGSNLGLFGSNSGVGAALLSNPPISTGTAVPGQSNSHIEASNRSGSLGPTPGPPISATQSSVMGSGSNVTSSPSEALVLVAKTLLALISPNVTAKANSLGVLSADMFMRLHQRLLDNFCVPITSPLSVVEVKQLELLYEREAYQVTSRSLSRELAQLANYFIEALDSHPLLSPQDSNTSSSATSVRPGQSMGAPRRPLPSPMTAPASPLRAALYELNNRTRQFRDTPSHPVCIGGLARHA